MIEKDEVLANEIPHVINWIYFGSKIFDERGEVRESFQKNMTQWMRANPCALFKLWISQDELSSAQNERLTDYAATFDGKLHLLDQKKLNELTPEIMEEGTLQHTIYQKFLLELTHPKGNYGAASDLFRLLILCNTGGIYADLDVTCNYRLKEQLRAPLDLLVYFSKLMAKEDSTRGDISNCIVAAPPRSPVIKDLFKTILRRYMNNERIYGSMEKFFHSRNDYELMNTSGSDAYRKVLKQRNKSLLCRIQPEYFQGQQCFDLDFLTQSVDPKHVKTLIKSERLEVSTSINELSAKTPRLWDTRLTHFLLNSTFEKAWLDPKPTALEEIKEQIKSRGR